MGFFTILSLLFLASPAGATHDVERALQGHDTLASFLGDPSAVERYYEDAARAYGGEVIFPRDSFDTILGQMADLLRAVPAIGDELWRVNPAPFVIRIDTALPSGPPLEQRHQVEALEAELRAARRNLLTRSDGLATMPKALRMAALHGMQGRLRRSAAAIAAAGAGKTAARRHAEAAAQWSELRASDEFSSLSAYLFWRWLEGVGFWHVPAQNGLPLLEHILSIVAGSPDLTLEAAGLTREGGDGLKAEIRNMANDLRRRINRGAEVFPPGSYIFQEVPRKFHAVFFGIMNEECVGGVAGCLPSTHPERWAVSALPSVRVFQVKYRAHRSTKTRPLGFLQYLDGHVGAVPATSLTISAPALRHTVWGRSERNPLGYEARSLFSAWLGEAAAELGRSGSPSAGFVLSAAENFERKDTLKLIRSEPEYLGGKRLGSGADFRIGDAVAGEIVRQTGMGADHALLYTGRMITDATIPQASYRDLTLLAPGASEGPARAARLPAKLRNLRNLSGVEPLRGLVRTKLMSMMWGQRSHAPRCDRLLRRLFAPAKP